MEDTIRRSVDDDIKNADMHQYVTFEIADEIYGVDALQVEGIIGMTQITYVPNSPFYMKGVINLRGSVVPVIDMRLKFRLAEKAYNQTTVILIVKVNEIQLGLIVDSVSEVVSLPIDELQDAPHFSTSIQRDFIKGIANYNEQLIIVIDADQMFSLENLDVS